MGRSFDNGRSKPSSAVQASSTLQASLREHSKLRSKRTRSYAATAKLHCERTRSYAARAKFHCEQAKAYLNLRVRLHRILNCARARSQWNFAHARTETSRTLTVKIVQFSLQVYSKLRCESKVSLRVCSSIFELRCKRTQKFKYTRTCSQ